MTRLLREPFSVGDIMNLTVNNIEIQYRGKACKKLVDNKDGTHSVLLTQDKWAIVDDSDVDLIKQFNWCYSGGYASVNIRREEKRTPLLMHQLLLNTGFGSGKGGDSVVDHEDGNRLNNQRYNIRATSTHDNNKNRARQTNNKSGTPGVYWHKGSSKWIARIHVNRKDITIGSFVNKDDAINARKKADVQYNFHENHGR